MREKTYQLLYSDTKHPALGDVLAECKAKNIVAARKKFEPVKTAKMEQIIGYKMPMCCDRAEADKWEALMCRFEIYTVA